jgi:hypothetical protein
MSDKLFKLHFFVLNEKNYLNTTFSTCCVFSLNTPLVLIKKLVIEKNISCCQNNEWLCVFRWKRGENCVMLCSLLDVNAVQIA